MILILAVLIPYQQGGLFRHDVLEVGVEIRVLIPYQQGGLFRRWADGAITDANYVLIPYQQGGLFRRCI